MKKLKQGWAFALVLVAIVAFAVLLKTVSLSTPWHLYHLAVVEQDQAGHQLHGWEYVAQFGSLQDCTVAARHDFAGDQWDCTKGPMPNTVMEPNR